ncbi:hypothetical protein QA640_24060 [Bradyrhizobium sp. CB82]|uniref:hypothetical protein n=1 Tax=Bradyrhizobium sp. CB82 TaxID=3039159 RepID=UPI0024B13C7D|nr:hypothetical protein [Bradyrhizobium sp. CB82]WFU37551.1 hypothetical protein QA640_24060 [Bradyrhizobium sp. CB82]
MQRYVAAHLERASAANEHHVQERLRRSYEQIARSEALLRIEVPKVWRPEPPEEKGL